jgi:DNA-binding NtrC family response regulator
VRELANVIERAIVLGSGSRVSVEDLPNRITHGKSMPIAGNLSYREGVNEARKQLILNVLSRTNGNRAAAAKVLGLEAKYLLKLMKSLRIE